MAQYRLRPVDACCLCGAVEDTLDRLLVLQSLTPSVIAHRDELARILGDAVADLIHKQKACEDEYETLVKRRSELKSLANKTQYKRNQEKIAAKARELQDLTIDLCRRLRESPNVSENLLKIQNERSNLITIFESFRSELQSGRSYSGIASRVARMKARFENMVQVIQADREMQRQIEELSKEIESVEAEMAQTVGELDGQVKEQGAILAEKSASNAAAEERRDEEVTAMREAQDVRNGLSRGELVSLLRETKVAIEEEKRVHAEAVAFLGRRQAQIKADMAARQAQFDADTGAEATTLRAYQDRIAHATSEVERITPIHEESSRQLVLEKERIATRGVQLELAAQQERFMNKLKMVFALHARIVPPAVGKKKAK